jgi:hypothetical protein
VEQGNFFAAIFKICFARMEFKLLNSNKILPAGILIIQYSIGPFPLPIRISCGFLLTGMSVCPITQSFRVFFFKERDIIRRAASICFPVNLVAFSNCNPHTPKFNFVFDFLKVCNFKRPLCNRLNFVFLGCQLFCIIFIIFKSFIYFYFIDKIFNSNFYSKCSYTWT